MTEDLRRAFEIATAPIEKLTHEQLAARWLMVQSLGRLVEAEIERRHNRRKTHAENAKAKTDADLAEQAKVLELWAAMPSGTLKKTAYAQIALKAGLSARKVEQHLRGKNHPQKFELLRMKEGSQSCE